jgi:hypothetical protein
LLTMALEEAEYARAALSDPRYFDDDPDPDFKAWDDRKIAWRDSIERARSIAATALQRLVSPEDLSPPKLRKKR